MMTENAPPPVILGRYAGFFSRLAAYLLDRAIISGITFAILAVIQYLFTLFQIDQWLESPDQEMMISTVLILLFSTIGIHLVVSATYDVGFWVLSGQTPGKRVLGVRVMRTDGRRVTLGKGILRWVGYWISAIGFLGYFWILLDNRRQGFHDKLAGTIVTYSWPEGKLRGAFVIERVQRFKDRRKKP
jgi:uncharacterized RDD family membrane protein YckC